jgi:predicted sugar kinase
MNKNYYENVLECCSGCFLKYFLFENIFFSKAKLIGKTKCRPFLCNLNPSCLNCELDLFLRFYQFKNPAPKKIKSLVLTTTPMSTAVLVSESAATNVLPSRGPTIYSLISGNELAQRRCNFLDGSL